MSVSSDHNSTYKADPAAAYPVLGSDSYETVPGPEVVAPVHIAASIMAASASRPANAPRIDAMSIRWGWWAASLGLSAVLWACIAIGLF